MVFHTRFHIKKIHRPPYFDFRARQSFFTLQCIGTLPDLPSHGKFSPITISINFYPTKLIFFFQTYFFILQNFFLTKLFFSYKVISYISSCNFTLPHAAFHATFLCNFFVKLLCATFFVQSFHPTFYANFNNFI